MSCCNLYCTVGGGTLSS